eukprot:g1455.t1
MTSIASSSSTKGEKINYPSGWFRAYDLNSGKFYYVNSATQATSWDIPSEGFTPGWKFAQQLKNAQQQQQKQQLANTTTTTNQTNSASETNNAAMNNNAGAKNETKEKIEEQDEDDWIQLHDEKSGKPYFYSRTLNQTSWTKPTTTGNNNSAAPSTKRRAVPQPVFKEYQFQATNTGGKISTGVEGATSSTTAAGHWSKKGLADDKAGRQMDNFFDQKKYQDNANKYKDKKQKVTEKWRKNKQQARKKQRTAASGGE